MTEEQFCEEQKALYTPIIRALDSVPLGERVPSNWQAPEGYTLEKFEVDGVPVEHLIPNNKTTDKVIFQTHGGGYTVAFLDAYRDAAVAYSAMAGGAEVFSLDYRVAPTHVYPAALEDAVKVYKWLLGQSYDNENIVIVGDSAGGNLALVTTLYLRDNSMPLPKGVIAISPWAKLSSEAESYRTNYKKDCILGEGGVLIASELYNPSYLGDKDYKDPLISPVYGDFKGFPNLLIQVGSHEILLDDAVEVGKRAEAAGVNVKTSVYPRMSHDFQLFAQDLPESQEAWKEMKEFIAKLD